MTAIRTTAVYNGQIEYETTHVIDREHMLPIEQLLLTERLEIVTLTFDDASVLIYEKV